MKRILTVVTELVVILTISSCTSSNTTSDSKSRTRPSTQTDTSQYLEKLLDPNSAKQDLVSAITKLRSESPVLGSQQLEGMGPNKLADSLIKLTSDIRDGSGGAKSLRAAHDIAPTASPVSAPHLTSGNSPCQLILPPCARRAPRAVLRWASHRAARRAVLPARGFAARRRRSAAARKARAATRRLAHGRRTPRGACRAAGSAAQANRSYRGGRRRSVRKDPHAAASR